MRYSMGFAGALLLALSTSAVLANPVRDAGSKIRGDWQDAAASSTNNGGSMVYRSFSVAPGSPAPAPAPAAQPAAPRAPQASAGATRSYSVQPSQAVYYNNGRGAQSGMAPYLRADHKIKGNY